MASKSILKIITTLAVVVDQCQQILDARDHYRETYEHKYGFSGTKWHKIDTGPEFNELVAHIADVCSITAAKWEGDNVTAKEMEKVFEIMSKIKSDLKSTKFYNHLVFSIGMLDDVSQHLKDWKAKNFEDIRSSMLKLFDLFKPENSKPVNWQDEKRFSGEIYNRVYSQSLGGVV